MNTTWRTSSGQYQIVPAPVTSYCRCSSTLPLMVTSQADSAQRLYWRRVGHRQEEGPAGDGAVGSQSACVVITHADRGEGASWRCGLVGRRAGYGAIGSHAAHVQITYADRAEHARRRRFEPAPTGA